MVSSPTEKLCPLNQKQNKKREEMKSILFLVYFQGVNGKKWKNFMKSAETITQWEKFRRRPVKQFYTRGKQGI